MKPLTQEQQDYTDDLLNRMTLREKIGQFNNPNAHDAQNTGALDRAENIEDTIREGLVGTIGSGSLEQRIKFQNIAVNESRMGIPIAFERDVIHGDRMIFPTNLGSSWNPELVERTAHHAAKEARSEGVQIAWAPMADVAEDSRWGRVAENTIESPYLTSRIITSIIKGYQGDDLSKPDRVAATAKHIGGYAFGKRGGEYKEVDMGPNKFHRTCLPPFKAAAEAGVSGYMLGFHTIDGEPMTSSDAIGTIITEHWGHEGLIATDYNAIQELENHGVAHDLKEAAFMAFKYSRVTSDLVSQALIQHLEELVQEGRITEEEINERCRKILALKVRLFWDENTGKMEPLRQLDQASDNWEGALSRQSRALAREAVHETTILLKNEDNALPLAKTARVALIGPLGGGEEARANMQGTWAVRAKPQDSVTLEEGMKTVCGNDENVICAKGSNIVDDKNIAARYDVHSRENPTATVDANPDSMIQEAEDAARQAEIIVMAIGEAKDASGESSSLSDIDISDSQYQLLKRMREVADGTGKKLVVVTMSGRFMALERIEAMADAMIHANHPGTEGGNGIADILYGEVNPSGKTTMSVLRHTGQAPMTFEELPTGRPGDKIGINVFGDREMIKNADGRDVRVVYDSEEQMNEDMEAGKITPAFRKFTTMSDQQRPDSPLFPFGYGLSYTQFEYGKAEVNKSMLEGDDVLQVSVKVKNTGTVAGKETVQLYKHQPADKGRKPVSHPVKELIGFDKKEIRPGEEVTFTFAVTKKDLSYTYARTMADYEERFEPGRFLVGTGPNSGKIDMVEIEWKGPAPEITKPGINR